MENNLYFFDLASFLFLYKVGEVTVEGPTNEVWVSFIPYEGVEAGADLCPEPYRLGGLLAEIDEIRWTKRIGSVVSVYTASEIASVSLVTGNDGSRAFRGLFLAKFKVGTVTPHTVRNGRTKMEPTGISFRVDERIISQEMGHHNQGG